MKKGVFSEFLVNEHGFTLISSLLRILIISLTLPLLVFALDKFKPYSVEQTLSIEQLFYILQNEVYLADEVTYNQYNRLLLEVDNNTISIEKYGALLRRRVNNEGHEVYYRDIRDFTIKSVESGVVVTITTLSGDVYERILVTNG